MFLILPKCLRCVIDLILPLLTHHEGYIDHQLKYPALPGETQYVLKYFRDDTLRNVGLMVLYELPLLGIAKCTWTCIEMLHLPRVPNMLPWRLLVLHVDPQPEPVSALEAAGLAC